MSKVIKAPPKEEIIKLRKTQAKYLELKKKHEDIKRDYVYLQKCYSKLLKENK